MPSLLAQLIAKQEGFGKPGALPTRRNNPGDLRHSPHSSHEGIGPNDIGEIDTATDGWADLERQLRLYSIRGLTLAQLAETYAPESDGNDTAAYLAALCSGLGLGPDDTVTAALRVANGPQSA